MKRRAGFTLIEVLAVVLLTGIVIGIALDFYLDLSRASNRAAEQTARYAPRRRAARPHRPRPRGRGLPAQAGRASIRSRTPGSSWPNRAAPSSAPTA